jgi:regulator of cell morphogenesis and NO signaling
MTIPETTTVREIAVAHPEAIRVFEKFGIDYCCGGRKPLAQACQERAVDTAAVLASLAAVQQADTREAEDWSRASLGTICAHIAGTHHNYVRTELPRIAAFAQKVVSRHGADRPELPEIQQLVAEIGEELLPHLNKEEMVLFPYIRNLEESLETCGPRSLGCFGTVRNPIQVMMAEHDAAGEIMARMRELSGGFTPPLGACPTYRGFYQALAEFEQDLHQHIHLENNILFPRAIELEESCG